MSDNTQATMSYEGMKAELEANGYSFDWHDTPNGRIVWNCSSPDGWNFDSYPDERENAIEKAWAHYQREKKFAAMEALLRTMIDEQLYMDTDDGCEPSVQLLGWIRRVEEILK